jgi:hypothetical protein
VRWSEGGDELIPPIRPLQLARYPPTGSATASASGVGRETSISPGPAPPARPPGSQGHETETLTGWGQPSALPSLAPRGRRSGKAKGTRPAHWSGAFAPRAAQTFRDLPLTRTNRLGRPCSLSQSLRLCPARSTNPLPPHPTAGSLAPHPPLSPARRSPSPDPPSISLVFFLPAPGGRRFGGGARPIRLSKTRVSSLFPLARSYSYPLLPLSGSPGSLGSRGAARVHFPPARPRPRARHVSSFLSSNPIDCAVRS